jgi:uncharacterized protein (DUF302 family)
MYAFTVEMTIPFNDFQDAVTKVKEALMAEKMGVVSEVNVQGIFKAKMELDIPGYLILGACVPPLAKRVIDAVPDGGALLPCNVVVREDAAGKVFVAFMDPATVLGLAQNEALDKVAAEATEQLKRVEARLQA